MKCMNTCSGAMNNLQALRSKPAAGNYVNELFFAFLIIRVYIEHMI